MHAQELEIWWSSLSVAQKERIARKALTKESPEGKVDESLVQYPACTRWWLGLGQDRKMKMFIKEKGIIWKTKQFSS